MRMYIKELRTEANLAISRAREVQDSITRIEKLTTDSDSMLLDIFIKMEDTRIWVEKLLESITDMGEGALMTHAPSFSIDRFLAKVLVVDTMWVRFCT